MRKERPKILKFLSLITICLCFNSCQNENFNSPIEDNSNSDKNKLNIKNGRLLFQNKESIGELYKEYAVASEDKLDQLLKPFYQKGFYSLRPIITEENEEYIYNHYKEKAINRQNTQKLTSKKDSETEDETFNYFDDIEEVIGDDTFASLLNSDGEIQIGEEIYKYTDVGLFITKQDKYDQLKEYLVLEKISENLATRTSENIQQAINLKFPNEGLTYINSTITYYKTSSFENEKKSDLNENVNSKFKITSKTTISTDPTYNSFLNNLPSCNPHSGIFGDLFGDNDVCIDKYESRRRVKTKAFNYNYLIVYHLGVKCVNQFRGWTGLWRVEATDEIKLIVEAAQFEYDRDKLLGNNVINNQTRQQAFFMSGKKAFFSGPNTISFNNEWGQPIITYANLNSLPEVFRDDLVFEFFGTGSDYIDGLVQKGIDSNLKASKFNEWFYSGLYSQTKSRLQQAFGNNTLPPDNRTFLAKYPQNGKMIIQKSVNTNGYNLGVRERTFDWGVKLCFQGGDSNSSWSIQPNVGCDILVKPTNFRVKIIGAIRKGNSWHGNKFNDGID